VALRVEDVLEGDWMKWHKGFLQKIIYYSITNILWRKGALFIHYAAAKRTLRLTLWY